MITKASVETAYCFFHQKWRVYAFSTSATQKDEIEYAIEAYVDGMDRELYEKISDGSADFLRSHRTFAADMPQAVERLERLL